MMGLTKVNEDWVPLQTKVFSRWVSTQLRSFPDIEVNDIQKDLSNGVALVDLATVLTQKKPSRGWCENPKLKIEMVQNCELALDMFSKDGVSFVGISGKDISDNNTKLILGLVWTLILHYSVDHSIKDTDIVYGRYTNASNDKINTQSTKSNKTTLLSWAQQRTEHYPNVHNFAPFDLSLCALLDSYFPNKVNYYSLNPEDSENNARLATKVMEEVGIPVYVYPEELQKTNNTVDEKTLLTQLSSAKMVLDEAEAKLSTETIENEESILQTKEVEKSESDETETDTYSESDEINELKEQLAACQKEIETLKEAREISERERKQASLELSKVQNQKDIEHQCRRKLEIELDQEKLINQENQVIIKELRDTISELQNKFVFYYTENQSNKEEIRRLRCAWDMAQIEIENERDARSDVEYELHKLKISYSKRTTMIEEAQKEYRLQCFMNCLGSIQAQMNHKIELIEQRVDKAQQIVQKRLSNHQISQSQQNSNSDDSEVERLRCAWDMGQIEIENQRAQIDAKQFELDNIKHEANKETEKVEKEEEKYRIPTFTKFIGQIQFQLNQKIELMEQKIDNTQQKVYFLKKEIQYYKNQNENLKLEKQELNSRLEKEEIKYRATLSAYEDAIQEAMKEAREQEEEREKADITIDHLMRQLNSQDKN